MYFKFYFTTHTHTDYREPSVLPENQTKMGNLIFIIFLCKGKICPEQTITEEESIF